MEIRAEVMSENAQRMADENGKENYEQKIQK